GRTPARAGTNGNHDRRPRVVATRTGRRGLRYRRHQRVLHRAGDLRGELSRRFRRKGPAKRRQLQRRRQEPEPARAAHARRWTGVLGKHVRGSDPPSDEVKCSRTGYYRGLGRHRAAPSRLLLAAAVVTAGASLRCTLLLSNDGYSNSEPAPDAADT